MTRTATVNYHVHKEERQAFELDAGGITGNLISPELAPTQVQITDVRNMAHPVTFEEDAVEFAPLSSGFRIFPGMRGKKPMMVS